MISQNGAENFQPYKEDFIDINFIYPIENGAVENNTVEECDRNFALRWNNEDILSKEPNGIIELEDLKTINKSPDYISNNDDATITDNKFSELDDEYESDNEDNFNNNFLCKKREGSEIQKELSFSTIDDILFKKDLSLKQYQLDALKWMLKTENNLKHGLRGGIISLEMGLGKTLISITYALIKWNENKKPSLIVCPKNLIENWKNEIEKFFGIEQCPYLILNHENTNSSKYEGITYEELIKYKLIMVSYHRVSYLAKAFDKYKNQIIKTTSIKRGCKQKEILQIEENRISRGADLLFDFEWNSILCDESHSFASHLSSMALGMMTLSADRKWCLTGTPVRNYSKDLYSQLRFLGLENVDTMRDFREGVFHDKNLSDFILFKSYEDCEVFLPQREDKICKLELSEFEREIYNRFRREAQDSYGHNMSIGKKAKILNLILKMRIICVSPYLLTKLKQNNAEINENDMVFWDVAEDIINNDNVLKSWISDINGSAGINSTKITKCLQIINSIPPNEKIVIYSMFKITNIVMSEALRMISPDVNYLTLNGDSKNKERYEIMNKFKTDPSIKIIFITYKVGGEGINLVEANNVILLEGWWNYCVLDQAISRVHRIGQNSAVKIWRLIVKDSIEEKMEMICHKKEKCMKEFMGSNHKSNLPDDILKELLID